MATLLEMLKQKAALEAEIEKVRSAEKAEAVAKIKALMAEHGLALSDFSNRGAAVGNGSKGPKGQKVAAKFRDPSTGTTWSGRGLMPNWLKAKVTAGQKIEAFHV